MTLDIPPQGKKNQRLVTGKLVDVEVDEETSLDDLIDRLNKKWSLKNTGKAYWIGYTNDMYSIAEYGDQAIPKLITFFETSKNDHAKHGVILTLHLIGIESRITGRFKESFKNKNARKALLNIIPDKKWGNLAVSLLARDPWKSDIPFLRKSLKEHTHTTIYILNSLFRYVEKTPFRQELSDSINEYKIYLQQGNHSEKIGSLKTKYIIAGDNFEKLLKLKDRGYLLEIKDRNYIFRELSYDETKIEPFKSYNNDFKGTISDFVRLSKDKVSTFSYCTFQDKFWHIVNQDRITIVDIPLAKGIWLEHFYFSDIAPLKNYPTIANHPLHKSEKDESPSFKFNPNKPFKLDFGRGSGRYGLNTISINPYGKVTLHRLNEERKGEFYYLFWENAHLDISKEQIKALSKVILENQLLNLNRSYHANLHDGTQWLFWLRQNHQEKSIYCSNHFPKQIQEFAHELDKVLNTSGYQNLKWKRVPHDMSGKHDKEIWDSIK